MPLYDYKCNNCGTRTEELHGHDEKITFSCENCNETLKKSISLGSSYFKGTQSDKTFNSNWRTYSDDTVETVINGQETSGTKRHESGYKVRSDCKEQGTDPSKLRVMELSDNGTYNDKKDFFHGDVRSINHMSPKYYPKTMKEMNAMGDKQDIEHAKTLE